MTFDDRDTGSAAPAPPGSPELTTPDTDDESPTAEWHTLSEEDRLDVFQALPRGDASEFYLSLDAGDREALLTLLPVNERRVWLRLLAPDEAADVIQQAPEEDRAAFLNLLDSRMRSEVEALLEYQADVAGGRMDPSYAWVRPDMTVAQALAYLRLQAADRVASIYYTYVLDRSERLLGVVSFRDLMAAPASRRVDEIMLHDPVTVHEDTDQESVARTLSDSHLLAVPVVDDEARIKGIVTVDDVIDVVEEEATEDIQKLGGLEALDLPYFRTRTLSMIRKRGGWLSVLFLGQMLTISALDFFERELASAVVLALFVPLIISSGGNAGSQAATLVIRAMALDEVRPSDWWSVARREAGFGLALGGLLAVLGATQILIWGGLFRSYGDEFLLLGLTVALSLTAVVVSGTMTGAALPFLLRRSGFDPASASAPLVATVVDVTGVVIYLSVARVILLG
jgi:magnesium transporter